MPTQKRRVNVTLGDDEYEMLHRLADLSGQSMGSIVRELVEAGRPTLVRMIEAMTAYAAADADLQRQMLANLESAHAALLPDAERVMQQAQEAWDKTLDGDKS